MAEYIVDGARLRCDQGICPTSLKIQMSRLCIAGKPAASQWDCVPLKNIGSFGKCRSKTYEYSAKAVKGKEHPCVLDLMESYYLPDEAHSISDAIEIIVPLERCRKAIRDIISSSMDEMRDIQHILIKRMNGPLIEGLVKQYGILWKSTSNVDRLCTDIEEVKQAVTMFNLLADQNCTYLLEKNGEIGINILERINGVTVQLRELSEQVKVLSGLPKIKEMHPITMESFSICRCGGILTFITSGQ